MQLFVVSELSFWEVVSFYKLEDLPLKQTCTLAKVLGTKIIKT